MERDSYSRRQYIQFATALAAGGLAGCTGTGKDNQSGGNNGDSSNKGITVWTDAWDSQVSDLQNHIKEKAGVEVTFTDMRYDGIKQKFLTGAKTGTPDVVEATPNHRGDYVTADLIEPLTDRVNELDYADKYAGLDTMKYEGEIWALPYIGNGRGFVYRKDIAEEYGGIPDDWSKFIEMASEITRSEDGMYGFTLTTEKGNSRTLQEFFSFLFQRVDTIFEPKDDGWELVASPQDMGQVFKQYYWDPFYATDPPATNPNARGIGSLEHDISYMNGDYFAISTGPWLPGVLEGSDNANAGAMENYRASTVTHNPRIEGGEKGTFREVKPIFMNKHSQNKDAAWEAIKAGTSPEGIEMFLKSDPGNQPAHKDIEWKGPEETENPDWAGFNDVFKTGKSYGFWSVSKVEDSFYDLSQAVVYDKTDPMEAGKQLHEQWSQMSDQL
ncbi:sugar ABC transporter substrate-binding protein [Halegenticoccus tardaugens]|uniref:sugar ABC transporter substrate-binding protein n=1 Tax=Halegenticoccus tardaugens TaxID=2071624 RepID=UPI0013E9875C|nr:extracellular solute-binding protein [Halegenticoccus tardaugens]